MSILLKPVDADNYDAVIRLNVREDQRNHVGSITEFLARAYVKAEGYDYWPFAVYADQTLVGFIIYAGSPNDKDTHYIIGFLIDQEFQGRGYGKAALIEIIRLIRSKTFCEKITITVHPDNSVAKSLYANIGFRNQGWKYQGEEVYSAMIGDLSIS